ncbi:MAG TPA: NlpC/P60 family protein [Steroidobacteraceae bacterium]
MITPAEVIAQARQWLGVKFLHQGRTRTGCDCLGFVAGFMAEMGSNVPLQYLPVNYARAPGGKVLATLQAVTREIPLQVGALVLIRWPLMQDPSHTAIFTGCNLIHCTEGERKVVEHRYGEPWVRRTHSIWALPEVQYLPQGDSLAI